MISKYKRRSSLQADSSDSEREDAERQMGEAKNEQ